MLARAPSTTESPYALIPVNARMGVRTGAGVVAEVDGLAAAIRATGETATTPCCPPSGRSRPPCAAATARWPADRLGRGPTTSTVPATITRAATVAETTRAPIG